MAKMKVKDFINKAVQVEKIPTLYGWGKYMNSKDGKYTLCDCSGLIKGILWGYPEKGKYNNNDVPDWNADTMISKCSKVSTNFNKLPVGALVWMKGHIGIHVGNGVCVESSPIWEDGIQCTFIRGSGYSNTRKLKERAWAKQGLFDKYVDYTEDKPVAPTPAPSTSYYKKYTGGSGVLNTVLKAVGVPTKYCGDWKSRKPVAEANGIKGYTGTADQNKKLISLAKQGKLKKV